MSVPTRDEAWLHDELSRLLVDEPTMTSGVLDDVARGEGALTARRRRRTAVGTVAALVVALAVPSVMLLRSGTQSAPPVDHTDSHLGHVWTPAEGYITPDSLAVRAALVAPPSVVMSSKLTHPPLPPHCGLIGPCDVVRNGAQLEVSRVEALYSRPVVSTVVVTEESEAVPDVSQSYCLASASALAAAGPDCTDTLPWQQVGSVWVTAVRSGDAASACQQEVVVRRGRTAVHVAESLPATSCGSSTPDAPSVDAAPLTNSELTAMALAMPLTSDLSGFVDVTVYGPELTASPTPSTTVPVKALWSPDDGYVTQDQFVARVRQAMPQGVTAELVGPSAIRDVPCGSAGVCPSHPFAGGSDNAQKPVTAAFNVTRGNDTGLLVLGEDTRSGNPTAALRTCLGYLGCTQLRPWTQVGDAWTAVFENVNAGTGLVDRTAYVVRGASAFGVSAQTQALRADDVLQTLAGATPVLTADELLAMAMTLPLGDVDGELIRHGAGVQHSSGPTSYDGVRACTAGDLVLALDGLGLPSGRAGTDLAVPMEIRADARHGATCVLSGIPSIRFTGGASDRLTVVQASGSAKVLISPVASALAPVTRGSCTAGIGGTGPVTATLFAPDGGQAGTHDVSHDFFLRIALAPCKSKAAAADTITVGPFAVEGSSDWPGPL